MGVSTDYKSAIKTVVATLGITPNDVDACLASADLRAGILSMRSEATATHGVNATPTFVLNGQKTVGALTFAQFSAIIDGL